MDENKTPQDTNKKDGLFQSTLKKLRPRINQKAEVISDTVTKSDTVSKVTDDIVNTNEEAMALLQKEQEQKKQQEIAERKKKFAESLKRKDVNQSNFNADLESKKVKVTIENNPNGAVILPVYNNINAPKLTVAPTSIDEVLGLVDKFVQSEGNTKATYQITEFIERIGGSVEVQSPSPEITQQVRFNVTFNKESALYPSEGYLRVSR